MKYHRINFEKEYIDISWVNINSKAINWLIPKKEIESIKFEISKGSDEFIYLACIMKRSGDEVFLNLENRFVIDLKEWFLT